MSLKRRINKAFIRRVAWVKSVAFELRLKWLAFCYKGAKNIPVDKLPKISMGDEHDEFCIINSVKIHGYFNLLSEHYKLDKSQSVFMGIMGRFIHAYYLDEEVEHWFYGLLNTQPPMIGIEVFKAMRLLGDIPDHKLNYFTPPAPYETPIEWMLALGQDDPFGITVRK